MSKLKSATIAMVIIGVFFIVAYLGFAADKQVINYERSSLSTEAVVYSPFVTSEPEQIYRLRGMRNIAYYYSLFKDLENTPQVAQDVKSIKDETIIDIDSSDESSYSFAVLPVTGEQLLYSDIVAECIECGLAGKQVLSLYATPVTPMAAPVVKGVLSYSNPLNAEVISATHSIASSTLKGRIDFSAQTMSRSQAYTWKPPEPQESKGQAQPKVIEPALPSTPTEGSISPRSLKFKF